MINETKKERESVDKKETEKMFEAIHKNAQESRDNYIMTKNRENHIIAKNIETIKREKKEKKERKKKIILGLAISLLFIGVISSFFAYENKQNDSCVSAGHSRAWCVVNG